MALLYKITEETVISLVLLLVLNGHVCLVVYPLRYRTCGIITDAIDALVECWSCWRCYTLQQYLNDCI